MTKGFWNRLKAEWYRKGLEHSTLPDIAVPIILEKAQDANTFLDVGSGCGTLAIPLAEAGRKVTALDASAAMIEILERDVKERGIRGIRTVNSPWGGEKLKMHDAVICSNVPALTKETEGFLEELPSHARKYVFIIEGADPLADKFYYRELYPLLFGREFGPRADYLRTYTALHSLGIFANVEMIEYDFDQPFDDMEEAMLFWKEYMGIVTEEHDEKLRGYLAGKLVKRKGGLLARFHKRSAIMWWRTGKRPSGGRGRRR